MGEVEVEMAEEKVDDEGTEMLLLLIWHVTRNRQQRELRKRRDAGESEVRGQAAARKEKKSSRRDKEATQKQLLSLPTV